MVDTSAKGEREGLADTVILNIALLPPPSVASAIAALSAELTEVGGLFRVDGIVRFAHLTLYMARFPVAAVDNVRDRASAFASEATSVRVTHTGYYATPGNYYEVSYSATDGIKDLHTKVTRALQPMRFSPGRPIREEYFGPYSPQQQNSAKETGYDLAGGLYRPHITITRFPSKPQIKLPEPPIDLSFEVDQIGLYEADDYGSLVTRIATFRVPVETKLA